MLTGGSEARRIEFLDYIVTQIWDDQQWAQNFLMGQATFLELCEKFILAL